MPVFWERKNIHQHKIAQRFSSRNRDEGNKQIPEPWMGHNQKEETSSNSPGRGLTTALSPPLHPGERRQEGKGTGKGVEEGFNVLVSHHLIPLI